MLEVTFDNDAEFIRWEESVNLRTLFSTDGELIGDIQQVDCDIAVESGWILDCNNPLNEHDKTLVAKYTHLKRQYIVLNNSAVVHSLVKVTMDI